MSFCIFAVQVFLRCTLLELVGAAWLFDGRCLFCLDAPRGHSAGFLGSFEGF